jgi:Trypsin
VTARVIAAVASLLVGGVVAATVSPAAAGGTAPGRQSRTSGVATAGADIYLWSTHRSAQHGAGCTLSFAVRALTTHRSGSLTAGHCVGTLTGGAPYTVAQTRAGRANTTDPGDRLGDVDAGRFRLGLHGDSAFVGLAAGRGLTASIFTGGTTSSTTIPVGGLARLHAGLHVCYSGAASGEHCGFTVVGPPETVTFPEHHHRYVIHHEWRATSATCPSRAGDSGSPVYVKRHGRAYAVGILSGGQKRAGRCPFFFTPVSLALSQLHLQLFTAPAS